MAGMKWRRTFFSKPTAPCSVALAQRSHTSRYAVVCIHMGTRTCETNIALAKQPMQPSRYLGPCSTAMTFEVHMLTCMGNMNERGQGRAQKQRALCTW